MTDKNSPKKPEKSAPEIMAKTVVKPVKKTNWALSFLLILIVFLLGAAGAIYFMPTISDRLPIVAGWIGKDTTVNIEPLEDKVVALENQMSQQAADIQGLKTNQDTLAQNTADRPQSIEPQLVARLEKLEQIRLQADKVEADMSQSARIDMLLNRMSQLEASFVPLSKGLSDAQEARLERSQLTQTATSQTEQLGQIESRLQNVEKYAARDNSGALLGFRLGELRRAVTAGQDFSTEIDALATLTSHGSFAANEQLQSAITWLQNHRKGLTTPAKLRDRFDQMIPSLIRAKSENVDDPWWMRAYSSAKNLVMVRKTNPTTADTIEEGLDKVITESQRLLEQFDLETVIALIKTLPENLQSLFATWMSEAELYQEAEAQLDSIESLSAAFYLSPEKSEKKPEKKPEKKDVEL